ncbi:MAG: hypothetical protein IJ963_05605 [Phascolarctobacterium sp.]|nr:hypothetical protein [Phascolarctobacterium sp.]MBR6636869.1 hypothetical protein [Phascolarctobacterium sp.]
MREIKFRGKTLKQWVRGDLSILHKDLTKGIKAGTYISNKGGVPYAYAVRPETVGQFTGLLDKTGEEIYEGDIVKGISRNGVEVLSEVVFRDGAFGVREVCHNGYERFNAFTSFFGILWLVVGNIYDGDVRR